MELTARSPMDATPAQQGYIDLIKASWILIEVIARHPQLKLLDPGNRSEVDLLASVRTTRESSWSGVREY